MRHAMRTPSIILRTSSCSLKKFDVDFGRDVWIGGGQTKMTPRPGTLQTRREKHNRCGDLPGESRNQHSSEDPAVQRTMIGVVIYGSWAKTGTGFAAMKTIG